MLHRAGIWRSRKSRRRERVTGERVSTPAGGFNPTWQRHVAAYALLRAAPARRGACSTSAAASATATTCSRRARRSGVDLDAEALAGQDRETRRRRHARAALRRRRASRALLVRAVDRARAGPRARAGRGRARARARAAPRSSSPRTGSRSRAPTRSSTPTTTSSTTRAAARRCARGCFDDGRAARALRLGALPGAGRRASTRSSTGCCARDPLRLRRLVPRGARQRLYDRSCAARARDADPARGGDRRRGLRAARRRAPAPPRPRRGLPGGLTARPRSSATNATVIPPRRRAWARRRGRRPASPRRRSPRR